MELEDVSIHAWIQKYGIKTEKGDPLTFRDHPFLFDIYSDLSPLQCVMKPAQIGMSTLQNVKLFWLAAKKGVEIIYTLPSDSDVVDFVGTKTNRLIVQNPIIQHLTKDRDTIESKHIGSGAVHFRGTWTKGAALMLPADVLIHDELDASKQDIVGDYETRLKHSKWKWRWYFSHPSVEGTGVHTYWAQSDQKHWFIKCKKCSKEQYLSWPDSIDQERECYQCRYCHNELSDAERRQGRWVKKYTDREFSGYWISSLMCPWVPAKEIIRNSVEKDQEYFFTKVLGLPYVGSGNKLSIESLKQNLTPVINDQSDRIVIGCDTGVHLHYVVGNRQGLFYYSESDSYDDIEVLLARWPRSVIVFDQGGDLISPRKLREKYPGRVFLCHFRQDRKTFQLIRWGEGEEYGNVVADRNRMIQLVVDEFTDKRIAISGSELDWEEYFSHWEHMYRMKEETGLGTLKYVWKRSGADHWGLATVYWRIGMSKFSESEGTVLHKGINNIPRSYELSLDNKMPKEAVRELILPDQPYDSH